MQLSLLRWICSFVILENFGGFEIICPLVVPNFFANSRPFLNHWNNFLTEGQNNFGNKIPIIIILSTQILTLVELSVWAEKKPIFYSTSMYLDLDIFIQWHFKRDIYKTLNHTLVPICCKKRQKIVPDQLLVWGIRTLWRFWMVPNWS